MNDPDPPEHEEKATRERVFDAADAMLREGLGRHITWRAIHERIHYGSAKTINAALSAWWTAHARHVCDLETFDQLPNEVAKPLLAALAAIQQAAHDQAEASWAQHRETAEASVQAALAERDAAQAATTLAATQVETLTRQLASLDTRLDTLSHKLEDERTRRHDADHRAEAYRAEVTAVTSQAKATLAVKNHELDTLQRDMEKERTRADAERDALNVAVDNERAGRRQDANAFTQRLDRLQQKVDETTQRWHTAEAEKAKLLGKREHIEAENTRLQRLIDQLGTQAAALSTALAERETRCIQLSEALDKARAQLAATPQDRDDRSEK